MNNNDSNSALNIFSQPVNNGRMIQPNRTEQEKNNSQVPNQQVVNEQPQPQNTFFQTKLPNQNTTNNSVSEKRRFNPFGDGHTLQAQSVMPSQNSAPQVQQVQNDAPKTIDSIISNLNSDKTENFVISDEFLLRTYIGNNYEIITNKSFNFSAFFFNGGYFLYRKVYDIGSFILGFLLICSIFIKDYSILFVILLFTNIISGFIFNKNYVSKSKKSIEKIKRKYQNEQIKNACIKAGGTSVVGTVIMSAIFVAIRVIFSIL